MSIISIIREEIDKQVGLFDRGGTGIVLDNSFNDKKEFYCGFDGSLRLKEYDDFSKQEWDYICTCVLDELYLNGYNFRQLFVNHNGFTVVEYDR